MNWALCMIVACLSVNASLQTSRVLNRSPRKVLASYVKVPLSSIRALKKGSKSVQSGVPGLQHKPNTTVVPEFMKQLSADLVVDTELVALQNKIHDGVRAQEQLMDKLEQLSQTKQSTSRHFLPVNKGTSMGDSWKKPSPKQLGVRINPHSGLSSKRRSEGKMKRRKKTHSIKSGRASAPSPLISKRFYDPNYASTQVQVEPSDVIAELSKAVNRAFSAGPVAQLQHYDDELTKARRKESSSESRKGLASMMNSQPAFCRRCYKFLSSMMSANSTKLYQYCCTVGSHKSEILDQMKRRRAL